MDGVRFHFCGRRHHVLIKKSEDAATSSPSRSTDSIFHCDEALCIPAGAPFARQLGGDDSDAAGGGGRRRAQLGNRSRSAKETSRWAFWGLLKLAWGFWGASFVDSLGCLSDLGTEWGWAEPPGRAEGNSQGHSLPRAECRYRPMRVQPLYPPSAGAPCECRDARPPESHEMRNESS